VEQLGHSSRISHFFSHLRHVVTWRHARLHRSLSQPSRLSLPASERSLALHNRKQLKREPFILKTRERASVRKAIREICKIREWHLQAINVRTNHVHTVVTGNCKPGLILNALKGNATRLLREDQLWPHQFSPWADKGSKIRLWNERSVANAIDYVLNGQGDDLRNFDD
jgi:REP element-mobilizing transposase RayT